jgi:hypothetical protein
LREEEVEVEVERRATIASKEKSILSLSSSPTTHVQPSAQLALPAELDVDALVERQAHEVQGLADGDGVGLGGRSSSVFDVCHCVVVD